MVEAKSLVKISRWELKLKIRNVGTSKRGGKANPYWTLRPRSQKQNHQPKPHRYWVSCEAAKTNAIGRAEARESKNNCNHNNVVILIFLIIFMINF